MANQPRTVTCPSCTAPKTTKANRGVRLVCASCGAEYRCPPAEPGAFLVGSPGPAAPATVTPEPATSAVTVARGRPVVPQTARPRERGTATPGGPGQAPPATGPQPATPAPVGEPDRAEPSGPARSGKTGDPERLRSAGRRGGLANYARSRRR